MDVNPPSTPLRTSAAASVSPGRPSYSVPAKMNLIRDRVAREREPAAAAVRVHPALGERAPGVVADEEPLRPLFVVEGRGVCGVGDAGLAAVGELGLVALAAPGTADQQHQCATPA